MVTDRDIFFEGKLTKVEVNARHTLRAEVFTYPEAQAPCVLRFVPPLHLMVLRGNVDRHNHDIVSGYRLQLSPIMPPPLRTA